MNMNMNITHEDVALGDWYGYDGDNVKVIEKLDNGKVVVDSPEHGEEEVDPSKFVNPYGVEY